MSNRLHIFRLFVMLGKNPVSSLLSVLLGLLWMVAACEPKPNTSDLLKNMVVETDVDNTTDFSSYSSYKMPLDTMGYFSNTNRFPSDTLLVYRASSPNQNAIVHDVVTEVKTKMDAAGYTWKNSKASADLWVEVYITERVSVATDKATLVINLIDIKTNTVVWATYISDLVSTTDDTTGTVVRAVDQAFAQSPYLKKQ